MSPERHKGRGTLFFFIRPLGLSPGTAGRTRIAPRQLDPNDAHNEDDAPTGASGQGTYGQR